MCVALESFSAIKAESKAVILGDMLELGDKSVEEHLKILKVIQSINADNVILVGPVFRKISLSAGLKAFSNVNDLIEYFRDEPLHGKTILIKGSRGMKLEKIFELL
jgi:UDP-N-acetylmuramoyl-tripeptide--D-alanyl-D-alanine ligase